jgi:ATP-binding cassette subfamily B protein
MSHGTMTTRQQSSSSQGRTGPGPQGGPPGSAMLRGSEKARDFKGTMVKLLRYLSPYKWHFFVVMLFAVASTVFNIIGPKILGKATTRLFEGAVAMLQGTGTGIDFVYIGNILALLAGLYIAAAVFSFIQGWIVTDVSMKITYQFRKDISQKINRLPISYFDRTSQGEVLSRVTNDVDTVSQSLNQSLTQIITSVITMIGVLVMMFSISWLMTLAVMIILPISAVFIAIIVKHSQKYYKQQQEYLGHVNGHVEEMFGGHVVVKAFNGEKRSVEKFNGLNNTLYSSAWKSQFMSGLMMPIMNFVGNLGYVAVAVLGGVLAFRNLITVGDIQAFIQYVRNFTQPIIQIANISNVLQQTAAASERVFEFLAEAEETPDTVNAVELSKVEGHVEFRNVRFGYTPDKTIITDFSAEILPGQKIAIVGPTGAGKTTIVKLLMRYYDIQGGAILVDGHDIRDFTRDGLRDKFGMVLQDSWLYNASLMENIRYGKLDATDEEVYQAARVANIDHFIRTMPDGYNMVLDEETSNISQGQKQLLTIARAVLSQPTILILDEATSSVDTRTEVLIQKAMDNLMQGRTSFIIAHRLSTIRNADRILVMDKGDIVEQGTHEDLLKKDGFYATIYNSQFEEAGIY